MKEFPIDRNISAGEGREPDRDERDLLDRALRDLQHRDFQRRWEAAKHFPKIGERALAPLLALLESGTTEPETRWFIARILGEFKSGSGILALGRLLQRSDDEDLTAMAAEALGGIGTPAIDILKGFLQNPDTRLLAVGALSRIRRVEIVEPLLSVVTDNSPEVRAIAIEALGSFHDERIVPVILDALRDTAPEPRRQAAIAAGYLAPRHPEIDFVLPLAPLLGDSDREIGQVAARSLGRLGSARALDALHAALRSPVVPADGKLAVVRALGWSGNEAALEYLGDSLPEQDDTVCQEIIAILSRQKNSESRERAIGVLSDFYNERVKETGRSSLKHALALALGELGDSTGRGVLLSLAGDREASVRLHASSALKKLARERAGAES
jgi:HEAT repeat protein